MHHPERANHCRSLFLPWVTTNCSSIRQGLICTGVAVSEGAAGPDVGGGADMAASWAFTALKNWPTIIFAAPSSSRWPTLAIGPPTWTSP